MTGKASARLLFALGLFAPLSVLAAPNEIKVFSDELAAPGESTIETHVNKASRAGRRAGNQAAPLQIMPEYSYGIWKNWELSLQLPAAFQQSRLRSEGIRAEIQYVAPHDDDEGFYWGFNIEAARLTRIGDPSIWNLEMIPILGMRMDRWHLIANPGLSQALSGSQKKLGFEPAYKVSYRTDRSASVGVEYYEEAGPIRKMLPADQRYRVLYLAWDGKVGKSDINVGVGRGLNGASDRLVFKAAVEFGF